MTVVHVVPSAVPTRYCPDCRSERELYRDKNYWRCTLCGAVVKQMPTGKHNKVYMDGRTAECADDPDGDLMAAEVEEELGLL